MTATLRINRKDDEKLAEYQEEKDEQKPSNAIKRKSTTTFTTTKIPCWMSMDLHLVDILSTQETFKVTAWLSVFFNDENGEFRDQLLEIDQNADESCSHHKTTLERIKHHTGNKNHIKYNDLHPSIRKKLPIKESFLLNSTDMEIKKCHLELYKEGGDDKNVYKIYFKFHASCAEHFELSKFPFDAQFLNLQIVYRTDDFYFKGECPKWLQKDDRYKRFHTNLPIKLTVKDSIKSQWDVEKPWIDLRTDRGEDLFFHFSVIRLRVRRRAVFYLVNIVLPLCLVVACSFASFIIPNDADNVGDKLAYIVTLLLTTAAFQYASSTHIPKTSETTMVDAYILGAYFILSLFALEITVVYQIQDDDVADTVDYVVVGIFGTGWFLATLRFLIAYCKVTGHCDCCGVSGQEKGINWKALSNEEMRRWAMDMNEQKDGFRSNDIVVDDDEFLTDKKPEKKIDDK